MRRTTFAFRFDAALVSEVGDGNFICSPYSIWLPLAALASVTSEPARAALLEALGVTGVSQADLDQAASRMTLRKAGFFWKR